jgi:hypothetical protein
MKINLTPLEQHLSYLMLFRGQHTAQKAQDLWDAVRLIVSQKTTDTEKSQAVRQAFLGWGDWMGAIYPQEDLLCTVCLQLGEEIVNQLGSAEVIL